MEQTKDPVSVKDFSSAVEIAPAMPVSQHQKKTPAIYLKEIGDLVLKQLKNGTSPFLPNKDGFVDLQPAYNIKNNGIRNGLEQIALLAKQKELGVSENGFVTFESLKKAQDAGIECKIMKESHGITIPVLDKEGNLVYKETWFNLCQIENSQALVDFYKKEMTETYEKNVAYNKEKYGDKAYEQKNPAEKSMQNENKPRLLNEKTNNAAQYLAQVLGAVEYGSKLAVNPEQAELFKEKAVAALEVEKEPGKVNFYNIKNLSEKAQYIYVKNHPFKKQQVEHNVEKAKNITASKEKKQQRKEPSYERSM